MAARHADLQNLITATDGHLFLDSGIRIRRFTPRIADLFNITASDEAGRSPISPTASPTAGWPRMPGRCCGNWCRSSTRCRAASAIGTGPPAPLRTDEDRIDGVVITFVDIQRGAAEEGAAGQRDAARAEARARHLRLRSGRAGTVARPGFAVDAPLRGGRGRRPRRAAQPGPSGRRGASARRHRAGPGSAAGGAPDRVPPRRRRPALGAGAGKGLPARRVWRLPQHLAGGHQTSPSAAQPRRSTAALRDLSHRGSRIRMAVVMSLARQTLRSAGGVPQLLARFEGRCRRVGRPRYPRRERLEGRRLLVACPAPAPGAGNRHVEVVELKGPTLGAAGEPCHAGSGLLHELATNAIKHGAHVQRTGPVRLALGRAAARAEDRSWSCAGGRRDRGLPPRRHVAEYPCAVLWLEAISERSMPRAQGQDVNFCARAAFCLRTRPASPYSARRGRRGPCRV